MTNKFSLCNLVNKPSTFSMVYILEGLYRALQLFRHGITLQKKKEAYC